MPISVPAALCALALDEVRVPRISLDQIAGQLMLPTPTTLSALDLSHAAYARGRQLFGAGRLLAGHQAMCAAMCLGIVAHLDSLEAADVTPGTLDLAILQLYCAHCHLLAADADERGAPFPAGPDEPR